MATTTKLQQLGTRTVCIEVYVAHADRYGVELDPALAAAWVARTEDWVCALTGGASTTYAATGRWNGKYERTTVVRGMVRARKWASAEVREYVAHRLAAYAAACNQETAGLTVDGQWWFAAAGAEG